MNIGPYSFEEFRQLAENFHGYAAPGLLIGGYMVEKAKAALPEGTLFEAVVESPKCLPDAVQLLTLCSTGNQRMKIHNLGRYAVSLFDKHTGKGFRVSLNPEEIAKWPELYGWFFKKKAKKDQDSAQLEKEIRQAGDSICNIEEIEIKNHFIGHRHMNQILVCPICGEAYPDTDGPICRGCQGEAPYLNIPTNKMTRGSKTGVKIVPVEEAIGKDAAHDMTRIEPGQFKGPEFRAGHRISAGDVCRLQQMGRFNVAVIDDLSTENDLIHENEAAEAFAKLMAGPGVTYSLPPKEGKIDFKAKEDGLFCVNIDALHNFNLIPQVMAASRQDASLVKEGMPLAGERAIPLFLDKKNFKLALNALQEPLFEVRPLRKAKAGILVTGTEVFKGLIEDKFIPIITAKLKNLGSEVLEATIVPDDQKAISDAVKKMLDMGIDLLITTGGLSVDPDDMTRQSLIDLGLDNIIHGVPVLPGTMSLIGKLNHNDQEVQVVGVPACALYYKTTFFDLILPRLLAGREFTRQEAAKMADGGYCLNCKVCAWPKCSFGK